MKSDRSLKENIKAIPEEVYQALLKLKPVQFNMKGAHKVQFGFIAQDVEETGLKDVVYKNEKGIRSIAMSQIIAIQAMHIQRLTERVERLESQNRL